MNAHTAPDAYARLTEPTTLTIQRVLPGPVERVWSWLIDGEKRRRWLAAGDLEPLVGAEAEFVWRNDELTDPPGARPEGFDAEHRMTVAVTEVELNRRLSITWGSTGGVTFELEPSGGDVVLTLTHRRIADRDLRLKISAGWHCHLDILADKLSGRTPADFWGTWQRLRDEYDGRIPA